MRDIRITRDYQRPQASVWRALTDPALIPLWTATGRGARPEGFSTEVGTHFKFVGRPTLGWNGVVECEVLEVSEPSLLRFSWDGGGGGEVTQVTYRLEPHGDGTRFIYEHTGFTGIGGFIFAKLVLGPVRTRMLDRGLPAVLDYIDQREPSHGEQPGAGCVSASGQADCSPRHSSGSPRSEPRRTAVSDAANRGSVRRVAPCRDTARRDPGRPGTIERAVMQRVEVG
jgi:uncharacterized protein YndB with AHSA1/START domain